MQIRNIPYATDTLTLTAKASYRLANRDRIEAVIGLAAPFLDVVLGVGDRISRIVEPGDSEYYPIRPGGQVPLPGEPGYAEDAALPDPEPPPGDGTGPRTPPGA